MRGEYKTPSRTSPKNSSRGCLCKDSNRYSRKCCDGSLWSQGIGRIYSDGQIHATIKKPPRAFSEGFSKGFE